ncbi:MAG TPA: tRNA uridine-5-carboxymethylaminomethyl(34) synthesis GTPase MnmE [Chitinivibrionales bacterium]|nr:tRNA uridine-5-carboxymethylaminomethyl(34) synthesis GTPase MnmE [Chitinivibrionales bacterium]
MLLNIEKTIAALSTGNVKSALAVIRVSGKDAFSIVGKCINPSDTFKEIPPKTICLYRFTSVQNQRAIDQITAIKYLAPNSYTGENMVEILCHGGEIIIEKILSELVKNGAVIAGKGEFTRRAFLNGKMNLVKVEAIQGLINSQVDKEYKAAMESYLEGYKQILFKWKNTLKEIVRNIEAEIEFPDEDDIKKKKKNHLKKIIKIRKDIEMEIKKRQKSQIIEKGVFVPIVGITNAGKSSLFNLMLECERSIVHWEEGTTRDMVSEDILIAGEKIKLLDTAGLRNTSSNVEQIGIKKTQEYINKAALIIWVTPANIQITEHEKILLKKKGKIICIISKTDLMDGDTKKKFCVANHIPYFGACLKDKHERKRIVDFIGKEVKKIIGTLEFSSLVRNQRQMNLADSMAKQLHAVEKLYSSGEEIISLYLRNVLNDIGEMVGDTTNEEILDSIFSEFCIGK